MHAAILISGESDGELICFHFKIKYFEQICFIKTNIKNSISYKSYFFFIFLTRSMINQTRYILNQTRVMINETYEESLICGMKNSLNSSNVTAIVMAVIFGIISLILAVLLVVFIKRRNVTIKRKKRYRRVFTFCVCFN